MVDTTTPSDAAAALAASQDSAAAPSQRPAKAKWTPKAKPSGEGKQEGKSAKELKKEKRAAAVAARGGQTGPPGDAMNAASTSDTTAPTKSGMPTAGGVANVLPAANAIGGPSAPRASPAAVAAGAPAPAPAGARPPVPAIPSALHLPPHQSMFYSHLPISHMPDSAAALLNPRLHPAVIRLGILMASGELRGANARTMALMQTFQAVIEDYTTPESAVLWKDLNTHLSPMIAWLETCRPKGVGGGNAIRWLKGEINRLGDVEGDLTDEEQKKLLVDAINAYILNRIEYADQVIADSAKEKIKAGDVVVTYARSSIVEKALIQAHRSIRAADRSASFEVIVVDSRPLFEGRQLLASLQANGIECSYTLLPLLSTALSRADIVFIGASALHSDGALYARAGTSLVALMAKEYRVPVVACVETYKFGERVALDGVATNELREGEGMWDAPWYRSPEGRDDGDDIADDELEEGKKAKGEGDVTHLMLMYDLTPPSLITAVCTEIGFIPPSSVPTVLGKGSGV